MPYNIIASTEEATVVTEYISQKSRSDAYQSEAALEDAFIKQLVSQGYQYLPIHTCEDLVKNLRMQLEKLNDYQFSDSEWDLFFTQNIANSNDDIKEKTRRLQEDNVQVLKRDNGDFVNITLIDKKNIHHNSLQVINQYEVNGGNHVNRYDVTILINGFPVIHIELKARGVPLKMAFDQIDKYQRDSFWAESGLYEYIQVFVISNGTRTKYYSNTTRVSAIKERANGKKKVQKTSHSFEFTSYWSDSQNKTILDLVDFTATFFAKHTLLNIITKYCVFTADELLLVMRPYQIYATEQILRQIEIASNDKKRLGTPDAGGYVWCSTGAGKTLTSFKTAQLTSKRTDVDKVLFVVDRKDLDYQTMKEYDRFEKGAANGNKNTATLQRQLEDKDEHGDYHEYKVIVTTMQKLDRFIVKNPTHDIYNKRVVMIFDECHRSQFGEMHTKIAKKFKYHNIFGFTGTPIFSSNSRNTTCAANSVIRTTDQAFGMRLHTYTIVDAIRDGNVLPFKIDYINTMKQKEVEDVDVEAINVDSALLAPERISAIVKYIRKNFNIKTKRGSYYSFNKTTNVSDVVSGQTKQTIKVQNNGFNSILAVSSIEAAKRYYLEFKKQMAENPGEQLKIATIFSYAANESEPDGFIDDEDSDSTEGLDATSRDFLEMAIADYNEMFKTQYDTSAQKFPNYYKDLSLRMKNREVDILIVVNMFLTGFDATTLNTLWVDKKLEYHGLIQAFSRTNRILNATKSFGHIICFRDLQKETDEAISIFGDKNASGMVLLKSFNDYYNGYEENNKHHKGYSEIVNELLDNYPLHSLHAILSSERATAEYVKLFSKILRLRNILTAFDDFAGKEIFAPIDFQDYLGTYNDIYAELPPIDKRGVSIMNDVVFEIELAKAVDINIDYILEMVAKYHATNCADKTILGDIYKVTRAKFDLRSKKELIDLFIHEVNVTTKDVYDKWLEFIQKRKGIELDKIIEDEKLNREKTVQFMDDALKTGNFKTSGTELSLLLPKISRFSKNNQRLETKQRVIEKLKKYFDTYCDC